MIKYFLLGIHRLITFIGVAVLFMILFTMVFQKVAESTVDEFGMRAIIILLTYTLCAIGVYGVKFFSKWGIPESPRKEKPTS